MTENEEEILEMLSDSAMSDVELSSAIDLAELYLMLESTPLLLKIVQDENRESEVREQAAKVIAFIGVDPVKAEIDLLLETFGESKLKSLLKLAVGKPKDHYG